MYSGLMRWLFISRVLPRNLVWATREMSLEVSTKSVVETNPHKKHAAQLSTAGSLFSRGPKLKYQVRFPGTTEVHLQIYVG